MKYNKLIRDRIPDIIRAKGGVPITHTATDDEYWQKLKEKLGEEVAEFNEAENAEELADIFEVLDAIIAWKRYNHADLLSLQKKKREERGGFEEKIILDES